MSRRKPKIHEPQSFQIELRHDEQASYWSADILEIKQTQEAQPKTLNGNLPRKPALVLEIDAACKALRSLPPKSYVTFYTSIRYLSDITLKKIENWRDRHWKDQQGNVVPYAENWIQLYIAYSGHQILWKRKKSL